MITLFRAIGIVACVLALSTLSAGFKPIAKFEANHHCAPPECGCSAISYHDLISPWHTYEHKHVPFIGRIMQKNRFVATATILNDYWLISSMFFFHTTKDIRFVIDRSMVRHIVREVVKIVVPPSATFKTCRFSLLKMNESLCLDSHNGTISAICLPKKLSHHYNQVVMPSYIVPAGYNDLFSVIFFRMKHFTLNCCYHEYSKCAYDGQACSSDFFTETDCIGCLGQLGAPIMYRAGKHFYLISVMCDFMGCEGYSPCATFPMVSHYHDFIWEVIKEP